MGGRTEQEHRYFKRNSTRFCKAVLLPLWVKTGEATDEDVIGFSRRLRAALPSYQRVITILRIGLIGRDAIIHVSTVSPRNKLGKGTFCFEAPLSVAAFVARCHACRTDLGAGCCHPCAHTLAVALGTRLSGRWGSGGGRNRARRAGGSRGSPDSWQTERPLLPEAMGAREVGGHPADGKASVMGRPGGTEPWRCRVLPERGRPPGREGLHKDSREEKGERQARRGWGHGLSS